MYRFQLVSDIHLESTKAVNIIKKANYLILAGDIGYPDQLTYKNFFVDMSKKFKSIFYVTGNHEYYQNWKNKSNIKIDTIDDTNLKIKNLMKECGDNIHFLNNDFYDLDNKLRIVGSTLWSNINKFAPCLSDSYQIYSKDEQLVDFDFLRNLHSNNVNFISDQITFANDNNLKLLMITHHLPSNRLILDNYKVEYPSYTSHFASNLDHLIFDPIKVWCAGHSHGFNKQEINGVDCYINAYSHSEKDRHGATLDFTFDLSI